MLAWAVLAAVAAGRLAELFLARRNTARLKAAGAVETGAAHYPLFFVLHAGWLAALAAGLAMRDAPDAGLSPGWLAAYGLVEILRVWTMASLGRFWTTRIVSLPGAALVRRGPYRWMRHPNYAVVLAEVAILPLALGLPWLGAVFTLPNIALIWYRVRIEDAALADRRVPPSPSPCPAP